MLNYNNQYIFIVLLSEVLDGGRKKKTPVQRPSVSCEDFKLENLEELMGRAISDQQGAKIREVFCDHQEEFKNRTVAQECREIRTQLSRGPKGRELNDIEPVCSSQKSGGQEFLAISGGVFWGTIVCSTAAWVFYKTCVKK